MAQTEEPTLIAGHEKCALCDYVGTKTQVAHHKRKHSNGLKNGVGTDELTRLRRAVRKRAARALEASQADYGDNPYAPGIRAVHADYSRALYDDLFGDD